MHMYTYTYYIFICSINTVLMPLQGLGRGSSRLWSFGLMALARLVSTVLLFQLTQLALTLYILSFMALNSFTEAFLFTLFLFAPFSLELVALGYQSLGLSPATGWWRLEEGIACPKDDCLDVPPASSNVDRAGNESRKGEMCSDGSLHPRVMVERSRGRECHVFITLSLRGFLS